jgi:hypothetical protein
VDEQCALKPRRGMARDVPAAQTVGNRRDCSIPKVEELKLARRDEPIG